MNSNKLKYLFIFLICLIFFIFLIESNIQNRIKIRNTFTKNCILFYGKNNRFDKVEAYYTVDLNSKSIYKIAYLSNIKRLKYPKDFYVIGNLVFVLDRNYDLVKVDLEKQTYSTISLNIKSIGKPYKIIGVHRNSIVCSIDKEILDETISSLLFINLDKIEDYKIIENVFPIGKVSNNGDIIIEKGGVLFTLNVYNRNMKKRSNIKFDISDNYYNFSEDYKILATMDVRRQQLVIFKRNRTDQYIRYKSIKIRQTGKFEILPNYPNKIIIQEHLGGPIFPFLPSPDVRILLLNFDSNKQEQLNGFPLQDKWHNCD